MPGRRKNPQTLGNFNPNRGMSRMLTIKNIYDKKFKTFEFDGVWKDTMGNPEQAGFWLIYGNEKNGKTWFSIKLAEYLSKYAQTAYVSAEEGIGKAFVETCERVGLDPNSNLKFMEYLSIDELDAKLEKRKSPRIIVLDNLTMYVDELKNGVLRKLHHKYRDTKLFIFIAHEEKNEPYTATAKLAKKLAKIIVRVEGLACFISGRCPGGNLMINKERAQLYHGTEINPQ